MGEGFEAHIHDCLRLVVREVEAFAQREFRLGRGLGGLDYLYHLVDVAYGDEQPAHDFGTLFRRFEVERRATHDYVALIGDVIGQYGFEPHLLRLAARYRHHIDGIAEFEIGLLNRNDTIFAASASLFSFMTARIPVLSLSSTISFMPPSSSLFSSRSFAIDLSTSALDT